MLRERSGDAATVSGCYFDDTLLTNGLNITHDLYSQTLTLIPKLNPAL